MRLVQARQLQIGEKDISKIKLDVKSRDDIPQILLGLQYLYSNEAIREEIFEVLEKLVPEGIDKKNGRPGMYLWRILVLGSLRLNLNWDYSRLQEMANNHKTIREMLGHGLLDDDYYYNHQTLQDNISLLTPEVLAEVNTVVVKAGHKLLKKKKTIS
jgi:chloramphenicol 3-O-phosphotransferase